MKSLTLFSCILALFVITLGAYTRLNDAGLGCPDWPGCYGHLTVPGDAHTIAQAEQRFAQPVESEKAWIEMIHRYVAGTLGICILVLAAIALKKRHQLGKRVLLPLAIVLLVILQALLGMWTVTLRLLPPIILLHLLGGLSIASGLWWLFLTQLPKVPTAANRFPLWVAAGIVILVLQISLGGWTSANYAALICPDFPYCQGNLLPAMDFSAFLTSSGIAQDNTTLVTIHMAHRIGALLTTLYLAFLGILLMIKAPSPRVRINAFVILALLATQVTLGILNIVWLLPISTAVAHNFIAALLLLALISAAYFTSVAKNSTPVYNVIPDSSKQP